MSRQSEPVTTYKKSKNQWLLLQPKVGKLTSRSFCYLFLYPWALD